MTTMITMINTTDVTMQTTQYNTQKPTSQCVQDLVTFSTDIWNKELYALMMVDSYGKLPPGVLQGGIAWIGLYDQCLGQSKKTVNQTNEFDAGYCLASLKETNKTAVILSIGICVPDSCSSDELMDLLNTKYTVSSMMCDKKPEYTAGAIICLTVLAFLGLLIIAGTGYETVTKYSSALPQNDGFKKLNSQTINTEDTPQSTHPPGVSTNDGKNENQGFLVKFLLCFSLLTNGSKILKTKQGEGSLGALNGIRVLSLWWVILGHTYVFPAAMFRNPTKIVPVLSRFTFQAIGNATVSVDSFFFLSGLLVTYLTLKYLKKNNGKLNWAMFYIHRYLRLTPVYMLVIFIWTTLMPHFTTGPFYSSLFDPNPAPGVENQMTLCQDYWWTNMLYINNLYPSTLAKECLAWSWYLANDMQFFIISPFVIYLLYHYFFIGIAVWGGLLMTCFGSLIGISIKYDIVTSMFPEHPDQKMYTADEIYVRPWARISTYLVGIALGYILYRFQGRIRMPRFVAVLGWMMATAIALAVVYGLYGNFHDHPLSTGASVVYITFARFAWAVALSWVVFACATGYGGPVNSLLSWSFWIPLARITYCAYLLHPIIMFVFYFSLPTLIYYSDFLMVYFFLGHLTLSYGAAFILSISTEAPFMALEKLLLNRGKSV